MLMTLLGKTPEIGRDCFVADSAAVIGDVTVGDDSSVWFGAVIRGDSEPIRIGRRSSIQDNATIHCDDGHPVTIGDDVTVGHNAIVHGATLADGSLVGMGAIVMNGAVIGAGSVVAAGAVVTQDMVVPPCSLAAGIPARVVKTGVEAYAVSNRENAAIYVERKEIYLAQQREPVEV